MTNQPPLVAERQALGHILSRLMTEVTDLDTLCKHAPRLISVAINTARIQAALESSGESDDMRALRSALIQISAEESTEETPW